MNTLVFHLLISPNLEKSNGFGAPEFTEPYSQTYLYGRAQKGLIRPFGSFGLLGPFVVDISLVFSSNSKNDLIKIRVRRT